MPELAICTCSAQIRQLVYTGKMWTTALNTADGIVMTGSVLAKGNKILRQCGKPEAVPGCGARRAVRVFNFTVTHLAVQVTVYSTYTPGTRGRRLPNPYKPGLKDRTPRVWILYTCIVHTRALFLYDDNRVSSSLCIIHEILSNKCRTN